MFCTPSTVGGLRSDETTRLSSAGGYRRGSLPLLSPRWVSPIGRHRLMRRCLPHGRKVQRLHPGYRTPGVAFVGAYSPDAPAGSGVRTTPRAVFLPEIYRVAVFLPSRANFQVNSRKPRELATVQCVEKVWSSILRGSTNKQAVYQRLFCCRVTLFYHFLPVSHRKRRLSRRGNRFSHHLGTSF